MPRRRETHEMVEELLEVTRAELIFIVERTDTIYRHEKLEFTYVKIGYFDTRIGGYWTRRRLPLPGVRTMPYIVCSRFWGFEAI